MKHLVIIPTLLTILGASFLVAQESIDVNAPKEEIEKIFQEQHYPIKVTFRVIDESGNPVNGADMDVGIDSLLHSDGYDNYRGKTNGDGLFTVESRGRGCTKVLVSKEGFYPSRPEVSWDGELNPGGPEMLKNGGFRPENPTVNVILKKIGNPIPMMVRFGLGNTDHIRYAPKLDEEIGYDLVAGDWVNPHGKGEVGDIQVMFKSDFKNPENYSTKAIFRFSNPDDGAIPIASLIGSESLLKYPRSAPANGYEIKSIMLTNQFGGLAQPKQNSPIGYFLRLRTIIETGTGKILSAKYGKIIKESGHNLNENPLKLSSGMWKERKFDPTPGFQISYYLNPTPNDRNLEYDQQNNLAPEADKDATYPP